jgi:hypothetical protein
MKTALAVLAIVAVLGAALLVPLACRQEENETCQTTSDCEGDLVCCFDGTNSSSTLGTCLPESVCTPLPDAGVDGEVPDGEVPDAEVPDAEIPDAEVVQDASVTQDASP